MRAVSIADAWPKRGEPFTAYERFGIPSYWVVDPDLDRPSLRAFELDGDTYRVAADVTGSGRFRGCAPFSVEIVPERLVAKLRRL